MTTGYQHPHNVALFAQAREDFEKRVADMLNDEFSKENQMVDPNAVGVSELSPPPPGSSGPVKPIWLRDGAGVTVEFRPTADITVLELSSMMVLMFKLTLSQEMIPPDWKGYIAAHGLGRHFVTIEPNEDVGV